MMKHSIFIKPLALMLFTALCLNQGCDKGTPDDDKVTVKREYSSDIKDWILIPFPSNGYYLWSDVNHPRDEWQVYLDKGVISVRPYEYGDLESPPVKYTLPVSDGKLVAYNKGEWGGDLWWYSKRGLKKYKISDDQIHGFINTASGVFGLEGYEHMMFVRGRLVKLTKNTNKWHSESFVNFTALPVAGMVDKNGSMIVVVGDSLVRVSLTGDVETLVKEGGWDLLAPNSIVVDFNDNFYIGMRLGVAAGSLINASQVQWLVPNKEVKRYILNKNEEITNRRIAVNDPNNKRGQ
jgi:hypothetical protein